MKTDIEPNKVLGTQDLKSEMIVEIMELTGRLTVCLMKAGIYSLSRERFVSEIKADALHQLGWIKYQEMLKESELNAG